MVKDFLRKPFRERWWETTPGTFWFVAFWVALVVFLSLLWAFVHSWQLTLALIALVLLWWRTSG